MAVGFFYMIDLLARYSYCNKPNVPRCLFTQFLKQPNEKNIQGNLLKKAVKAGLFITGVAK